MFQTGYPPESAKNFDTDLFKERISLLIKTYNQENCTYLSAAYMLGTHNLAKKQNLPYIKVSLAKNIKEVKSASLEIVNHEQLAATLIDKIKATAKESLEKKGFAVNV